MPASGSQYSDKIVAIGKIVARGLLRNTAEVNPGAPQDSCTFVVETGTTAHPDVSPTAGTYALIADVDVPKGMKCYITSFEFYVGATLWGGGTGGTISFTLQDTALTTIATATQTALAATTYVLLPTNAPPSGVVDTLLKTLGASTAVNKGFQVLVANSSTGTPIKVRAAGYFAP